MGFSALGNNGQVNNQINFSPSTQAAAIDLVYRQEISRHDSDDYYLWLAEMYWLLIVSVLI